MVRRCGIYIGIPPLILGMVNGYVTTDTVVVAEMAEGGETRFASVTEDDIDILVQNKDSENISKAAVAVFRGYLLEKGKCADFTSLPLEELRELLRKKFTWKPEERIKICIQSLV